MADRNSTKKKTLRPSAVFGEPPQRPSSPQQPSNGEAEQSPQSEELGPDGRITQPEQLRRLERKVNTLGALVENVYKILDEWSHGNGCECGDGSGSGSASEEDEEEEQRECTGNPCRDPQDEDVSEKCWRAGCENYAHPSCKGQTKGKKPTKRFDCGQHGTTKRKRKD